MELLSIFWVRVRFAGIALLCSGGFLFSFQQLWHDLHLTGEAGVGESVATLAERSADVQRKTSTNLLWNFAEDGEKLYLGDSVWVGALGHATIQMDEGKTLELQENSLVVIEKQNDLPLRFLEGSFVLRTKEGDQKIVVGVNGKAKIEPLPNRLMAPRPWSHHYLGSLPETNVSFKWQWGRAKAGARIQVSTLKSFAKKSTIERELEPSTQELALSLPAGFYFWRLISDGKAASEVRSFSVEKTLPLTLLFPEDGFTHVTGAGSAAISFRWMNPAANGSAKHELELAKDPDFKNLLTHKSIDPQRGSLLVSGIAPGEMFWRARSTFGTQLIYSRVNRLQVLGKPDWRLTLAQPVDGAVSEMGKPLRLEWNAESPDCEFRVEIENQSQRPDASADAKATRAKSKYWSPSAPGVYRWRVRAADNFGRTVDSTWRSFTVYEGEPITLLQPDAGQRVVFWDPPPLDFKWKMGVLPQGFSFRFEIASDFAFKETVFSSSLKEALVSLPKGKLSGGTFFWRVVLLDAATRPVKSSRASKFEYRYHALLEPPEATTDSGEKFDIVHHHDQALVKWKPVNEASAYELAVRARNSAAPWWKRRTKDLFYRLPVLGEGDYEWTLATVDPVGRSGKASEIRSFHIGFGQKLRAPSTRVRTEP